jgi:hypothetical protein
LWLQTGLFRDTPGPSKQGITFTPHTNLVKKIIAEVLTPYADENGRTSSMRDIGTWPLETDDKEVKK